MANVDLLEPIKAYKQLKDQHYENAVKYFDELAKKSAVNIGANKITCEKIHKQEATISDLDKAIGKLKGLLSLFVVIIIAGVCLLGYGIYAISENKSNGALFLVIGILALILGIVLIATIYKPKITVLTTQMSDAEKSLNALKQEAYSQMYPLNSLFDASAPAKLFQQTCPLIEMDRVFDVKKYTMMQEKYDLWDNSDVSCSTLDLQSGSILGNPFVIFKDLNMKMCSHTYTGSITISYYVGSGDNRHLETQVLTASVTEPEPVYSKDTYLIYGNEACQRLSFSRSPSNINNLNDKQIISYVDKHEKDLDKLASKQLSKGGTYTPIGNPEFELFFGGLDRDNEVEFRMLFTALGQKNMMDLLKSKDGYGDDFSFRKIKGLNVIMSRHSQGTTLFVEPEDFYGYEYDTIKENFVTFNDNYFKALFFDFAPLLSIPLYQQTKTHEYIYKDVYKSNLPPFVHETVANKYDVSQFAHKLTKTNVILKTQLACKNGETDVVNVTAHSFDAQRRVTYINKMGGDGRSHSIPVEWIEYIPLQNTSAIQINDVGVDDRAKFKLFGATNVIYAKGLVSNIGDALNVDIKQLKALMKKD